MNARNDVKRLFEQGLGARRAPAAVRLRVAALVDSLVAHWLARCAANIEAAQVLFETDPKSGREFGMDARLRAFER